MDIQQDNGVQKQNKLALSRSMMCIFCVYAQEQNLVWGTDPKVPPE